MLYDFKDSNDDIIATFDLGENDPQSYVGEVYDGVTVASVSLNVGDQRRKDRALAFSQTLDKMTPDWRDSLTDAQRLKMKAFRLAWLDFPTSDASEFPSVWDIDENNTGISTDVSDIF